MLNSFIFSTRFNTASRDIPWGTTDFAISEFIETENIAAVTERVHAALLEEMSLEDRINDEVRVILEAYSDEMRRSGANYQEMFRKVKSELVKKYKAVL